MSKKQSTYFFLSALITVFSLAYCAMSYFHVQLPRYYPTLREWMWINQKGEPSMGWYGMLGASLIIGFAVSGIFSLILKSVVKKEIENPFWIKFAGALAAASSLLMMAYYGWHEYSKWIAG